MNEKPLLVTPDQARKIRKLLSEPVGTRDFARSQRRNGVQTYLVGTDSTAPAFATSTIQLVDAAVFGVEGGTLERKHDVKALNVTEKELPAGKYLAGRDPYSGIYILAGSPGDDNRTNVTAGGVTDVLIGKNQRGNVTTDVWGTVEALNVTTIAIPPNTGCDVRREPASGGTWKYSVTWWNVCSAPADWDPDQF